MRERLGKSFEREREQKKERKKIITEKREFAINTVFLKNKQLNQ